MNFIGTILNFRRAYINWLSVLFQMYFTRKVRDKMNVMIKVKLRDAKNTYNILRERVFFYAGLYTDLRPKSSKSNSKVRNMIIVIDSISFLYDNYKLKFDIRGAGVLRETFIDEIYSYLKVKDKVVIDIGANIGDTAIYFAIKGTRKVISLEPYPYIFNIARKNFQTFLTNYPEFRDKIVIINGGYWEDKEIKMDVSFISNAGSDIKESENGTIISLYSLKTLVNKYNIDSGILKMDCEGCEYNLLNEDDEIIKKFAMIQIEYHYGYEKLVDKLKECGFAVKYTEPRESYNPSVGKSLMYGYIYAERLPVK